MFGTFSRDLKLPEPSVPLSPRWVKDDRDRRLLLWLAIKDFFRFGYRCTFARRASYRQRQALTARRQRDLALDTAIREYDKAIRKYDDYLWERGSGITSSGYIIGSAGEFI